MSAAGCNVVSSANANHVASGALEALGDSLRQLCERFRTFSGRSFVRRIEEDYQKDPPFLRALCHLPTLADRLTEALKDDFVRARPGVEDVVLSRLLKEPGVSLWALTRPEWKCLTERQAGFLAKHLLAEYCQTTPGDINGFRLSDMRQAMRNIMDRDLPPEFADLKKQLAAVWTVEPLESEVQAAAGLLLDTKRPAGDRANVKELVHKALEKAGPVNPEEEVKSLLVHSDYIQQLLSPRATHELLEGELKFTRRFFADGVVLVDWGSIVYLLSDREPTEALKALLQPEVRKAVLHAAQASYLGRIGNEEDRARLEKVRAMYPGDLRIAEGIDTMLAR